MLRKKGAGVPVFQYTAHRLTGPPAAFCGKILFYFIFFFYCMLVYDIVLSALRV